MLFFSREVLQICKFWTQIILAGNQSKQRGPLHIYLENQDGVRQRQEFPSEICVISFAWSLQTLAPVLVVISRPDNMQLHELHF